MPQIYIHNVETNEEIVREMTPEETANYLAEIALVKQNAENEKLVKQEQYEAKVAAYSKLGLTTDEIDAILPKPDNHYA